MTNEAGTRKGNADTVNPVKVRFARIADVAVDGGVVHLDADDFARFEECMNKPKGQTRALLEAAQLHREFGILR